MDNEQVIEKVKHIDRYKDCGDIYTREDVEAISKLLNMYENEKFKRMQAENDKNYLIKEIAGILSKF